VAPSSTMSPSVGSFDLVEACPKPISTPELRTSSKTPNTTTVIEAKEAGLIQLGRETEDADAQGISLELANEQGARPEFTMELHDHAAHAERTTKSGQSPGREEGVSPPLFYVKWKKSDHHGTAEDEVFTAAALQAQEATPKRKKGAGQTRKCAGLYEDEERGLYWVPERRDELQEDSCENDINTEDEGSSPL
jgi:hypothetical protein